ncbi:MAG: FtsQ-type POTRA domain-containing protein [Deltaproteobacteria bacterium]|nr:FtsQ-type POTRA domain-containing protein [Deltaproteobacteria bacterium]
MKIRANRRSREPFGRRLRGFVARRYKFVIAAVSLSFLVYGGVEAYDALTTSPRLAVQTIEVTGHGRVSKEEAVELSGIREGENILTINVSEAADNIRGNPWVGDVRVKRTGFASVAIEIKERTPTALIRLDGLYVMDVEGTVFKRAAVEDALYGELPVITGFTETRLKDDPYGLTVRTLELIRILKNRRGFNIGDVSEISVDGALGLSVYTVAEGVRIDVGVEKFGEKLDALEKVLHARGGSFRGIEAVDINNGRGVIVKFTTNTA